MSTSNPHEPGKSEAERPQAVPKRLRGPFKKERRRIADWRHERPFWAGFFILLGSLPILYFPYATLHMGEVSVAMSTMAGAAAAVIGCVLILMGLMVWFQPQFRIYAGVTAMVCGFISFVTSNLGGFFMGLLCVTIGGSLALAWSYDEDEDDGEVPAETSTETAPGGAGLGESSAGSATSRPGSTPDPLDSSSRTVSGVAKFGAIAGFPAVALVAALLPMGPSDDLPPNPFADGPCVSASPSASTTSGTPSATPSTKASGGTAPKSTPPPTSSAPAKESAAESAKSAPPAVPTGLATTQVPAPAETTKKPGLLDPIVDPLVSLLPPFLRPNEPTTAPPTAATPPAPPVPPAPPALSAPSTPPPASAPTAPKSAPATTPSTTPPTSPKASTATATPTPTPSPTTTGTKTPYPCPSQVPLDAAPAAPGGVVLPDEPWILKSSLLAMAGMDYKGVVDVTTGSGKTKPVLKFEVSGGVDIWNLDMTSPVDDKGNRIHVFSIDNVKSYMKDGTVTFYTESLKGNLFGLIPVEFTPTSPPPLNVPVAFFTDVTVRQAGQTGATLVIPDLTMRSEHAG